MNIRINKKSFSVKIDGERIRIPYSKIDKAINTIVNMGEDMTRLYRKNSKFPLDLGWGRSIPRFIKREHDLLFDIRYFGKNDAEPSEVLNSARKILRAASDPVFFEDEFFGSVAQSYGITEKTTEEIKTLAEGRKLRSRVEDRKRKTPRTPTGNQEYARYKAWVLDNLPNAKYTTVMSATSAAQLDEWVQQYEAEGLYDYDVYQRRSRKDLDVYEKDPNTGRRVLVNPGRYTRRLNKKGIL